MASQPTAGYSTITAINFTGGFPSSADLAPSIIFTILYVATIPILLWRFISPAHRSRVLIRPAIFLLVRLASLILRAAMSKTNYNVGELIAELVLISIGYLFLISPIITLWQRHCIVSSPPPHPGWVNRLGKILQLTLLAAIATAIASGSLTSGALESQSGLNTVVQLRHASYILSLSESQSCVDQDRRPAIVIQYKVPATVLVTVTDDLVVVVLELLAIVSTHIHFRAETSRSAYPLIPTVCLLVVAVYRVAQTFETNPTASARTLAAFWCLQILFEFFGYCSFLAISIPEWYPNPKRTSTDSARDIESTNAQTRTDDHARLPSYDNAMSETGRPSRPRVFGGGPKSKRLNHATA